MVTLLLAHSPGCRIGTALVYIKIVPNQGKVNTDTVFLPPLVVPKAGLWFVKTPINLN